MQLRTRIWNTLAVAMLLVAAPAAEAQTAKAGKNPVERGKYLSIVGGCNDCHSPKLMTPHGPTTDPARILSSHPATERLPSVPPGVSRTRRMDGDDQRRPNRLGGTLGHQFAANLTPDAETGIDLWTVQQFIQTLRYRQAPRRRQTSLATDARREPGSHDRFRLEGVVFILAVAPAGQESSTGADSAGSLAALVNHRLVNDSSCK